MKEDFKQNKSKRGKKSKISFDEEVISKDQAEKLLSEQGLNSLIPDKHVSKTTNLEFKKKNKKRQIPDNDPKNMEKLKTKKKRNSENPVEDPGGKLDMEGALEGIKPTSEPEITKGPKKESNRSQKRKKHAKLLEEKKLNTELELQQKALNYLSKWKHSRSEWKFEKLKQVWIQQNLFDTSKIPETFWETTVEYFSGAKGHSHQAALDVALKIIENEEASTETNSDEEYQVKLKRARDIVQNLQ